MSSSKYGHDYDACDDYGAYDDFDESDDYDAFDDDNVTPPLLNERRPQSAQPYPSES